MIFITLGTQKFQLNRLLREVDKMISEGKIQEEVFAQIGYSDYKPQNYKYVNFLPNIEYEKMIENSDLLITHSGVGTIVAGLKKSKPIIVYPRLAKFKEHVDDHQLQIAHSFAQNNYVLVCDETDDLSRLVRLSKTSSFDKYISKREFILDTINNFLDSF